MTEDELSSIAQQLVGKLRDEDPEAVNRWLSSVMPSSTDWYRLCFVLAAAVPDDKRWSELMAWWINPPPGTEPPATLESKRYAQAPCGSHGAYRRHRKNGEMPCQVCVDAERARDRERRRKQRAEQREAA